jgi:uncharacterized protein
MPGGAAVPTSTEGILVGTLKERLAAELKEAMKARDAVRLRALRMLTAGVKNREVEVGHELSDQELQEVAATEVKRRKEAAEAFAEAGRSELAEQERAEEAVLQTFLPERLSEEEVAALIEEAVAATGATGPGDLGKVMGHVMGRVKGRVDGGEVNRLVRERLSG